MAARRRGAALRVESRAFRVDLDGRAQMAGESEARSGLAAASRFDVVASKSDNA